MGVDLCKMTLDPLCVKHRQQLYGVAMASAVPFVGFGFMDNAIMIVAGCSPTGYFFFFFITLAPRVG